MAERGNIFEPILEQLRKAKIKLTRLEPLLKRIGVLVAKECRKAFAMQKLGLSGEEWPARYEGMAEPFINIAGALTDWNAGRANPKPNRFQDRPALIDEGNLRSSITSKVGMDAGSEGGTIYVGTNRPYAALHQEGGWTEIPITDRAKEAIYKWLYSKSKKFGMVPSKKKVTHHGRSGKGEKQKTAHSAYAKHIEPLLYRNTWKQRVARRPFIGMTDQAEHEVGMEIRKYLLSQGVGQ